MSEGKLPVADLSVFLEELNQQIIISLKLI